MSDREEIIKQISLWRSFRSERTHHMKESDPSYLTVLEREQILDNLCNFLGNIFDEDM